jgi:hypothetical protein
MIYKVESKIKAEPKEVFDALHQYKKERKPGQLFNSVLPPWLVKINFRVLTDNVVGLGATYDWEFKIFGITILKFKEKIIEWEEPKVVAYQAVFGWEMFFKTELEPVNGYTIIKTQIDFSPFRFAFLDWLFTPVVEWGLKKVNKQLKDNIRKKGEKN